MLTMAIGTHRGVGLAPGHQPPVDPFPVVILDPRVALAAGERNVEVIDARVGEPRGEDAVRRSIRGVAVVAARSDIDATPCGLTVHRCLVDLDRMIDQNLVLRGEVEVLVTGSAGLGQVDRVGH